MTSAKAATAAARKKHDPKSILLASLCFGAPPSGGALSGAL